MITYIVKRLKDGQYLNISKTELDSTLNRTHWENGNFVKDFVLVGEDKGIDEDMEKLFGTK
jgi:hypothetical protein